MAFGSAQSFWSSVSLGGTRHALTAAQSAEIRAQGLEQVRLLTPVMVTAATIDILTLVIVFWAPERIPFLVLWASGALTAVALWATFWWQWIAGRICAETSARTVRSFALLMALIGAVWTIPTLAYFHETGETQRVVIVASATGMLAGGAIALATVWQAALLYELSLLGPSVFVLARAGEPLYYYLLFLAAVFMIKIWYLVHERGRLMVETYVSSADLREQSQVISLLLKEFEESASDWLFELDGRGRLARCGERLAALLGRPAEALVGLEVMALLDPAAPEGAATRKILARAWSAREAVCDRVIPVRVGGAQRWWSVTAKPVFAANGAFVGYRGVGSDVTAAKIADAAIERLARFDALTGLPNRAQLDEAMRADLQDELGPRMAVLSLDLDRFKSVNDTLGHQIGDQLLQSVAARLKNLCGQADLICRLGGDEFVVLLRGADRGQAARFATRAIEAVGERYDIEGYRVLVGASVGVAMAGEDGADPETLLRNSDLALYRAKTDGKGRFCFFEPEMDVAMQARRLLEIELRDALQRRAIEVHFQPVIDAASGLMTGCEALARWTHPVRGPIPPARFIPLAEETGLIVALGENVLLAACAEAAQWRGDLRVAVNLSAAQFKATDFVSYVRRTLAETGLRPDRLELEVTESVLIEDREAALAILSALRALGVRVSLDDFGTGYSSLSYLSSFPFDKIKIDRSFVRHVETRPDADAIIRAIVSIAGTLGMSTTAEGVETQIEFDRLRAHGCDEVQGFLFSAAVPPQELRRLIAEGRLEPLVAAA